MNEQTSPASPPWTPLLAPGIGWLALIVLVGSFFMPPTGFGVDLCPVHSVTGLPCPGCGMTRAIALISQGDPLSALGANPFVVFVWPVMVGLAALALLPGATVTRLKERLARHQSPLTRVYRVVLFAFMGFGALRFALFLALWQKFPG